MDFLDCNDDLKESEYLPPYLYAYNNPILKIDSLGLYTYSNDAGNPVDFQMQLILLCFENCIGHDFIVTGGQSCDPRKHAVSATKGHCPGRAADIGFNTNGWLRNQKMNSLCCAKRCRAQMALWESNHLHLQADTGRNGGSGAIGSNPLCGCEP